MARHDPVSDTRNQAIFALVGIGRPAVLPVLAEALGDPDRNRRSDARTALFRLLGLGVTRLLADEDEQDDADLEEPVRVMSWWRRQSGRFDPERAYLWGNPPVPAPLSGNSRHGESDIVPYAILNALNDWTGQDFGRRLPLSGTITKWQSWWLANRDHYETGRRYFHGYPAP